MNVISQILEEITTLSLKSPIPDHDGSMCMHVAHPHINTVPTPLRNKPTAAAVCIRRSNSYGTVALAVTSTAAVANLLLLLLLLLLVV